MKIFFLFLCLCLCLCFFLSCEASDSKTFLKSKLHKSRPDSSVVFESDKFSYDCEEKETTNPSNELEIISKLYLFGTVPRPQFTKFWGVSIPTVVIGSLWEYQGTLAQIVKAFSLYSIYFHLPKFFGYRILILNGPIRFEKMKFSPANGYVSLERWAMAIVFWFCQILLFVSDKTYDILVNQYYFPNFQVFAVITIVSCLFTIGLFDLIDNFFQMLFDAVAKAASVKA